MAKLFLPPFLLAALTSFLATAVAIWLAWHTKLIGIDDPVRHHHAKVVHSYPVPRGGGLPIFLAVFLTSLVFLPHDKHFWGIMGGAFVLLIVGLLDDHFDLSPYLRLAANLLAAGLVVASGIGIAFISNPFDGVIHLDQPRIIFEFLGQGREIWVASSLFGLLWLIWNMNIVGWSSGVDGQLPGFVVIASLVIAALGGRYSFDITQWPVIILAAAVAGAYLGFLPWNFYPQKIMPGYGGKSLAGFFLGVLAILSGAKVATTILVLGVPTADAIVAILRRVSAGHSPVWGDRGHLHHRLLDMGFAKPKIAVFYWLFSLILGVIALFLNSQQKFYAFLMVFLILAAFYVWLKLFPRQHS